MAYINNDWIDECKKPVGEALSARVYIRLLDAGNVITQPDNMLYQNYSGDPGDENAYGDIPTGDLTYWDVWTRTGTNMEWTLIFVDTLSAWSPYTPYALGGTVPVISTGSSSADCIYHQFDNGDFSSHDCLLASIHICVEDQSSILDGSQSSAFTLGFINGTGDGSDITGATFTLSSDSTIHYSTGHSDVTTYGAHLVQGSGGTAWWRIWVGFNMYNKYDPYAMAFAPNTDEISSGHCIIAAPQLETNNLLDRETPSDWYGETIANQPGSLVVLSGDYDTIMVNPISQKRERQYGVLQGQNVQLTVPDPGSSLMYYYLDGCWAAIEAGFKDLDEWQVVCNGRIHNAIAENLKLTFTIDDALLDLIEYNLPWEYNFNTRTSTPFSSECGFSTIEPLGKGGDSSDYDNEYGFADGSVAEISVIAGAEDDVTDGLFTIEFVSTRKFKVLLPDGTYIMSGGTVPVYYDIAPAGCTSNDLKGEGTFTGDSYDQILTHTTNGTPTHRIPWQGWDCDSNAYAAGDKFVYSTTAVRPESGLTPTGMIKTLVDDVVGLRIFNTKIGVWYNSPWRNEGDLDDIISGESGVKYVAGDWEKGSSVVEMIQDCLKLVHGSIYTSEYGTIGYWNVDANLYSPTELIGDPDMIDYSDSGQGITILDIRHERQREVFANEVRLNYKDWFTGKDVSYITTKEIPETTKKQLVIDCGWRIDGSQAADTAGVALTRFGASKEVYTIKTTLAGGCETDLDRTFTVYDPLAITNGRELDIIERTLDIHGNTFTIKGWNDPFSMQKYYIVGDVDTPVGSTDYVVR